VPTVTPCPRQVTLVSEHLAAGRSVVVDNTNPTVDDRRRLIELGRRHGARVVGYWFTASVREAIARNARRRGAEAIRKVGIVRSAAPQRRRP
jgi:predicted kinase